MCKLSTQAQKHYKDLRGKPRQRNSALVKKLFEQVSNALEKDDSKQNIIVSKSHNGNILINETIIDEPFDAAVMQRLAKLLNRKGYNSIYLPNELPLVKIII